MQISNLLHGNFFFSELQIISGVARDSAARGGSRNCRPQMQWYIQDLAKGGGDTTRGFGAKPPAANKFLRFSHKKTLFLTHFYIEKGHAVSAVTTGVARILQWEGG